MNNSKINKKISKVLKKILLAFFALVSVGVFGLFIMLKITNIDMTDMRLFITYWREILISLFVLICSSAGFIKTMDSM